MNKKGDVSFDWVVIIIILLIALFLVGYFIVSFILGQQKEVVDVSFDLNKAGKSNEVMAKISTTCNEWKGIGWSQIPKVSYDRVKKGFSDMSAARSGEQKTSGLPVYKVFCDVLWGEKYILSTEGSTTVYLDVNTTTNLTGSKYNTTIKIRNIGKFPSDVELAVFSYNDSMAISTGGNEGAVGGALNTASGGLRLFTKDGFAISETNPLNSKEITSFNIIKDLDLLNYTLIADYMNKKDYRSANDAIMGDKNMIFSGQDLNGNNVYYPYASVDANTGIITAYIYVAIKDVNMGVYVPYITIEVKK